MSKFSSRVAEVSVSSSDATVRTKSDLNFLDAIVRGASHLFDFPQFYLVLFQLLTQFKEEVEKFAIGIPRGFAKTTFLKLLCVWYVLFSHKQFILIVSGSEKKAISILSDICDMLSSSNLRRLFGNWDANVETDQSTTKVFHFRGRDIVLWAVGAGTSVRGVNRKDSRPDVIIMDDIQEREDAPNADLADALLEWMLSTLMLAASPFECTYIFVGNMYPQNAILQKLKNDPSWTSFIVGGITADGESLWEDLKPIDRLLKEYESLISLGKADIFISEILNSTEIALASGIDIGQIPFLPQYYLDVEEGEGGFIIIDPSSGKKRGDDCSISHYEVMDGKPIFDEVLSGTFSPLETIKQSIEIGLRRNTRLIGVEGVAYQSTLLFWFDFVCKQEGITGFHFVELSPKGQAKNSRIKKGLVKLLAGEIYLHPNTRSIVLSQIVDWNPIKIDNTDDIIDPIGYVEEVLQEFPELIIRSIYDTTAGEQPKSAHADTIDMPF